MERETVAPFEHSMPSLVIWTRDPNTSHLQVGLVQGVIQTVTEYRFSLN